MAAPVGSKAWWTLVQRNDVIPCAWDRNLSPHDSVPFNVHIRAIEGFKPKSQKGQKEFQLRVSLFDLTYKQFFGRTWSSSQVPLRTVGQKNRLVFNQNLYFHSSLNDPSIVAVVEVLAVTETSDGLTKHDGCGWGIIRVFKYDGDMPDTSSGSTHTLKMTLYHGSPRALLYLDEPVENNETLTSMQSTQMVYTIQTHKAMQKAMHLIPENVLLGANDAVPGLSEGTRDPKNPNAGVDWLRKPRLLKELPCAVEKVSINLTPTIDKVEEEICHQLNEDRINKENKVADGATISVQERRLQIGIHNGWCYVEKPEVIHLSTDLGSKQPSRGASFKRSHKRTPSGGSVSSGVMQLIHKNRIELSGMVEDPSFTLVFILEYVLGEPRTLKDRRASMARSSTFNVAVRWAAWCPLSNLSQSEQTLQLLGGPNTMPDSVFVYRQNVETVGSSSSLQSGTGGNISFSFVHEKKLPPPAAAALSPRTPTSPGVPALQLPPDSARTKTTIHGDHEEELQGVPISGRPPIPSRPGTAHSMGGFDPYTMDPSMYGQVFPGSFSRSPVPGGPGMGPFGMGGMGSMHTYLQSPRPYMPIEIQHVSDGHTPQSIPSELQELPFTPVHVPIMATVPGQKHTQTMSRAAYARLFTAGFPPVLDKNGEAPEVVDPEDKVNFVMAKEDADRLKANEIVFQFLAYSRLITPDSAGPQTKPGTVFFTFQFYRFPQVTSERLLLGEVDGGLTNDPGTMPCLLQKLDRDASLMKGPPGYQVKYHVDPTYLKPGEGRLFLEHLSQQTLHIDVWDGDSLMLIGTSCVDLQALCRQGREAVQVLYEVPVIATEHVENEMAVPVGNMTSNGFKKPMDVHSIVKGRLHLRLANIGHHPDPKFNKSDRLSAPTKSRHIVQPDAMGQNFFGGGLNSTASHQQAASKVCKALHMAEADQQLAAMLYTRKNKENQDSGSTNQAKQRKLHRMEALRQAGEEEGQAVFSGARLEKEQRARDMKLITTYREQSKRDGILNILNQSLTTEHVLYPSLGTVEFFEFALKNPYNVQHTVTVEVADTELSVITDPREWRHFKMLHNVLTPVEEGMFNLDGKSGHPEIFLRPKESVNIPFKFLSYKTDQTIPIQAPADPFRSTTQKTDHKSLQKVDPMDTRVIKVHFRTEDDKPVSVLAVRVEPQPHIVDQTFRFHHPEQTFLKKSVRMPPLHTLPGMPIGGPVISQVFVRCSDPNVICESKKVQQGEPHDIFVKVACGASPAAKKFNVCVYADAFLSRPIQLWQFCVHAMQRVDVSCIEGQTSRFTLILRGTQASRLVQCFTSHSNEMQVEPHDAFMLAAGALQEVHVGVRPLVTGSKFMYIHVVDIEYHQLVRAWLVCVTCRAPIISKVYELQLPVGGGKGSNKRIAFTNPYPHQKSFHLRTNRQDLLQFKENMLTMGAGETQSIGLRFAPSQAPGSLDFLVFINDPDDNNEETFCIKAAYA